MKKTIAALFAVASAAVYAGMNDLVISFSTPGPDKYADGSVVLDKEYYSLIWTSNVDGSQKKVLSVQAAKNGKCVPILFTIDEKNISSYENGTWGVYLLDTRVFEKDADGNLVKDAEGNPVAKLSGKADANVMAAVANGIVNAPGAKSNVDASEAVTAGAYDLAAAGVPQPTVEGIAIEDANVVVTVGNTVPFVKYTLLAGKDVSTFSVPENVKNAAGDDSGIIKIVAPKKDGAQFFKVSTIK